MTRLRLGALGCLFFVLTGCATSTLGVRYPNAGATDAEISRDLERLPQDLMAFVQEKQEGLSPQGVAENAKATLLPPHTQQELATQYKESFYGPWKRKKSLFSANEVFYFPRSHPQGRLGYAENLRPVTPKAWRVLLANANKEAFPSRDQHGITVVNTALRALPTHKPFFKSPEIAGEGYPFDYFSHSALWIGSPVYISHASADGLWLFVETQRVSGWVPARDVALVNDAFKSRWQSMPLGAVMQDGVVLSHVTSSGVSLPTALAHVGTLLPLENGAVFYPTRNTDGQAQVTKSPLANLRLSAELAGTGLRTGQGAGNRTEIGKNSSLMCTFPQPLTAEALARVGNVMMGQPYGWGGYLENRDCSALMLDIFTPFGVWLPRNSAQQGKAGRVVSLQNMSASQKSELIRQQAKPFTTLIWLPGHIVLYVGEYEGIPSIYHDIWGVSIQDETGARSRAVIGKVAVTSLSPGRELKLVSSPSGILDRMGSMVFLGE